DMLDHLLGRRAVLFQHLLDQVDAAARTVEFVAEQHIGRAGRGTKAAMHAGAQDLVGFRDIGIGELRQAEFGFHAADPRIIRPRLRMCFGSKLWRTRSPSAASPLDCGWNTSMLRLISSAARSKVACPPALLTRSRSIAAWASGLGGTAAQIRPPPQSQSRWQPDH